jgi:hypothetical protein
VIHTEAEAKGKWCPMVRAGMYGEGTLSSGRMVAVNRDPREPDLAPCIGSACMMWRWFDLAPACRRVAFGDLNEEPARPAHVPASWKWCSWEGELPFSATWGWLEPDEEAKARRRGYCGLSGYPVTV